MKQDQRPRRQALFQIAKVWSYGFSFLFYYFIYLLFIDLGLSPLKSADVIKNCDTISCDNVYTVISILSGEPVDSQNTRSV